MESLTADFNQFSRTRAKTFLNVPHVQKSLKSFGVFFKVNIWQLVHSLCGDNKVVPFHLC